MKSNLTVIAMSLAFGMTTSASAGYLPKDEIKQENARISAEFKTQKQICDSRSGNARDICMAEAKGREKVAKAELESRDKNTAKAREEAAIVRAEATFNVANQRCDDFAGNVKDVCRKDAQAAFKKAKAEATLAAKTAEVRQEARDKISTAQSAADKVRREADYKADRERCDALAGSAKESCISQAKARYNL